MVTKSIKKNYVYNLAYQVLILITPILTTPYISRVLKPDGIGFISFAESMVSYFALFAALGISIFGQREISYVRDNIDLRSKVFWKIKIYSLFSSTISLALYILFSLLQNDKKMYLILAFNILTITEFMPLPPSSSFNFLLA